MRTKSYKLYISPCPNDTFMFDAIINRRIDLGGMSFDVEYHDIEQLNERALRSEADITKCSTALLPQLYHNYALLDSGSALGRGNGPLLVRRKGDTGPLHHVAVPGLHTTANMLLVRLFPDIDKRTPMLFSDIAEAVERGDFDAGVLIHEGRFVYHKRNLELVADLGVEWERRLSLPLPLGSILASRNLQEEEIEALDELLLRSIEYAFQNPEDSRAFIKEHAQEMDDDVIERHISLFVNSFSLSLGSEGRRAVEALCGIDL